MGACNSCGTHAEMPEDELVKQHNMDYRPRPSLDSLPESLKEKKSVRFADDSTFGNKLSIDLEAEVIGEEEDEESEDEEMFKLPSLSFKNSYSMDVIPLTTSGLHKSWSPTSPRPSEVIIPRHVISRTKGGAERFSKFTRAKLDTWGEMNWFKNRDRDPCDPKYDEIIYQPGDLVYLSNDRHRDSYFAMCIKTHVCSPDKKPVDGRTHPGFVKQFEDFVVATWTRHYRMKAIGQLIVLFVYQAEEFWWLGCTNPGCGNLRGLTNFCWEHSQLRRKSFLWYQDEAFSKCSSTEESNTPFQEGSLMLIDRESINDSNLIFHMEGDVYKEEGIALLKRCFGNDVSGLIDQACLRGTYCIDSGETVDLRECRLWNISLGFELVAALLFRVHKDLQGENTIMLEILFLATSEHARHTHVASQVVEKLSLYAREQCIEILSVAAVWGQGEGFWSSMGFKKHFDFDREQIDHSKEASFSELEIYLRHTILIFDDTPVYVKLI